MTYDLCYARLPKVHIISHVGIVWMWCVDSIVIYDLVCSLVAQRGLVLVLDTVSEVTTGSRLQVSLVDRPYMDHTWTISLGRYVLT